jgi:hypothetical protein
MCSQARLPCNVVGGSAPNGVLSVRQSACANIERRNRFTKLRASVHQSILKGQIALRSFVHLFASLQH